MISDDAHDLKNNSLQTVIDIVVAPTSALTTLRTAPTWRWALAVTLGLSIVGYLMQRPSQLHAAAGTLQHIFATNPYFSNMTATRKDQLLKAASSPTTSQTAFAIVGVIINIFIAVLVATSVLLLGSKIAHGKTTFAHLWAASITIAVPTIGLSSLVLGLICMILGTAHFAVTSDVAQAMPGLATIVPNAKGLLGDTLIGLNVFTLWQFALNVLALKLVANARGSLIWIIPALILIVGALINGLLLSSYG